MDIIFIYWRRMQSFTKKSIAFIIYGFILLSSKIAIVVIICYDLIILSAALLLITHHFLVLFRYWLSVCIFFLFIFKWKDVIFTTYVRARFILVLFQVFLITHFSVVYISSIEKREKIDYVHHELRALLMMSDEPLNFRCVAFVVCHMHVVTKITKLFKLVPLGFQFAALSEREPHEGKLNSVFHRHLLSFSARIVTNQLTSDRNNLVKFDIKLCNIKITCNM